MMNTHYITFILRLRLDGSGAPEMYSRRISGSVQQVGFQEFHYFDSPKKLHETLQEMLPTEITPSGNTGQPPTQRTEELNNG